METGQSYVFSLSCGPLLVYVIFLGIYAGTKKNVDTNIIAPAEKKHAG